MKTINCYLHYEVVQTFSKYFSEIDGLGNLLLLDK